MKKRQKAAGKIPKQNHETVREAATEQSTVTKQNKSAEKKTATEQGTAAEQKAVTKQDKSAEKKTASKQESAEKPKPRMKYKDTIFRMLFNNKENLLSLYNAVNNKSEHAPAEPELCYNDPAGNDKGRKPVWFRAGQDTGAKIRYLL